MAKLKSVLKTWLMTTIGLSIMLSPTAQAAVREYWIAAEKVQWNYAPSGRNLIAPEEGLGVWGKTLTYGKYQYIGYTDRSYTTPLLQPKWRGILGPELRALVGDTLLVHFLNRTDRPVSIHPHGVAYDQDHSGGDPGAGAAIPPGGSFTYVWKVDKAASPGPDDPSSIVWVYHSHVGHDQADVYAGLIGTIIVTKRGMAHSHFDPQPRDVEHEFTTMFFIFDEEGGEEPGLKHAINGLIFGNLQGLVVKRGDRVRWHLIGMGNEVDLHTVHWHGQTVLQQRRRTDVVELLPGSMASVTMQAERPGDWLFHCHVADHMAAGMMTRWQVREE